MRSLIERLQQLHSAVARRNCKKSGPHLYTLNETPKMLPRSLPPITDADLTKLDALRLERLRICFKALNVAAIYISGLDRTLIISGGINVALMDHELKELKTQAWLIAACTSIKVYCCNRLILDAQTTEAHKLGDSDQVGAAKMVTAIQESLAQESGDQGREPTPQQPSKIMRSLSLFDIAADLEAEPSALQSFLEEQNATLIDFGGTIIVPETEAMTAYEHYSLVRARQKMEERLKSLNAESVEEKPKTTASKENKPKEPKPKKNYLTWKTEFKVIKSSYKKTLQNALNALFPDAEADQNQALTDIVNQTEMGKAYIDKIARDPAYTDKARARENLLKAAEELATPQHSHADSEKEEKDED